MIPGMKLLHGLGLSLVCTGMVACSLNAVEKGNRVLIRIEDQSPGQGMDNQMRVAPQSSASPPPPAVTGFDCIGVNVTGPGISDSSRNPEPNTPAVFDNLLKRTSYCTYRGILAGPISTSATSAQEISLVVPPGNPRLVQLVGFKERNGSTDCINEFLPGGGGGGSNGVEADAYEIGRAVIDLFQDKVVSITPEWNGLSAADQDFRELKCNSSNPSQLPIGSMVTLPTMNIPRYDPGVYLDTRLAPPKIFIVGGATATAAEYYDLGTDTPFIHSGTISSAIYRPVVVPDPAGAGKVFRLGGAPGGMTNQQSFNGSVWAGVTTIAAGVNIGYSSSVYSPAQNSSYFFGADGLPSTITTISKYAYGSGLVSTTGGVLTVARARSATAVLTDGSILIAGGTVSGNTATGVCDIFTPPSTVTACASLPTPVYASVLIPIANGDAMLIGGATTNATATNIVQRYSRSLNTWTTIASLPEARGEAGGVMLPDGRIFIAGGRDAGGAALMSTVFYENGGWHYGPNLSVARMAMGVQFTTTPATAVYLFGGKNTGGTAMSVVEKWIP
jgi:hypothetical protein